MQYVVLQIKAYTVLVSPLFECLQNHVNAFVFLEFFVVFHRMIAMIVFNDIIITYKINRKFYYKRKKHKYVNKEGVRRERKNVAGKMAAEALCDTSSRYFYINYDFCGRAYLLQKNQQTSKWVYVLSVILDETASSVRKCSSQNCSVNKS